MTGLRPPIQYGCFARYPDDGQSFIHPDDVAIATRVIPSGRVLCRHHFDGIYYHYSYGKAIRFRLRPVMWLPVDHEGLDLGDEVETRGPQIQREQFVARIWGMHWVPRKGRILYRLQAADGFAVPRLYVREELKLLTDKRRVQPSAIEYPVPRWAGNKKRSDRLPLEET
ncbi:MAG: hypothetical protein AAF958_14795 [Planctomycetota bacterium]